MGATEDDKRLLISRPPLGAQEHPWLLIQHGRHKQLQSFYSILEDRCYVKKVPQLCNKYICSSDASGWLVLEHNDSDECFLFNLVSLEKIQLPLRESIFDLCVLTSPPSDPKCRIVFISNKNHSLFFCRPGDSEFDEQTLERGDDLECATAFEGKFYGLRKDYKTLVVLDFSDPKPQFRQIMSEPLGTQCPPDIIKIETYIIKSCGELLLVQKMWHGLFHNEVFGFLIFRVDFFTRTWVEVKSISEDRAIFLDSHDGMSALATKYNGIRGNSIYFNKPNDRCLYVFNLENLRISIFLPSPTAGDKASWFHPYCLPLLYVSGPRKSISELGVNVSRERERGRGRERVGLELHQMHGSTIPPPHGLALHLPVYRLISLVFFNFP
ncbi:hypothetical protein RHMOL_Rhmol10G0263800 [Rhododendron molle]|uniref:Uncharacterized protein n=1 Tax=Rhododendron molle TaxID=49168 RepID=A0ACC0M6R6_RHOML|nr:hypothetical protein RHMOL_Rhmol10G0263800 [Rhododendron molle]